MASSQDIFGDYTYFSSYSQSWVAHAHAFAAMARDRFKLGEQSHVIEIASNDGYLLRNFVEMKIPCLGIEPAANVAKVAVEAGVPTEVRFFGTETARDLATRGLTADLIIGNNVLAHVPDPNDFIAGLALAVKPGGVFSFEFPHLQNLLREVQFDTIYHEHFSYLSLHVVMRVFRKHGLEVFDVERLPTHGGSLRVFAAPAAAGRPRDAHVDDVLHGEITTGMESLSAYRNFSGKVKAVRDSLRAFLLDAKSKGAKVAAYGAAAKGATLLNYSNVTTDLVVLAADRSPHKQHRFMPGCHLPILPPEAIIDQMPDYLSDPALESAEGDHGRDGHHPGMGWPLCHCDSQIGDRAVIFRPTKIAGVMEIELEPQADERGMFARAYCEEEFRAQGLKPVGIQCNISRNKQRHTLRGLHYQADPAPEAKLVRCIAGRVFDVAVDLRQDSPTFLAWVSVELDAERGNMLYVDEGCAHGFLTLTDGATVFYQMGAAYQPKLARGVRWNDPRFAIAWPSPPAAISDRDAGFPDFRT